MDNIKEDKIQGFLDVFEEIFYSSPEPITILHPDFSIWIINKATEELFGYGIDDLKNKKITDIIHKASITKAELFFEKFKDLPVIKDFDISFIKKDGSKIECIFSGQKILDKKNNTKFYVIETKDITHFKVIEKELLIAKEKAEQADRLKSAFLANMSHEIRTPMNAIIGFSNLVIDPNLTKDELAYYTGIIKDRCSNLLQIVGDILDISKIEANQVSLKNVEFLLNPCLDEIYLNYAQKIINENKFNIILNLTKGVEEDNNSVFVADENRLKQIINNLLDNAIKFTKKGEIEFGYKKQNESIEFFVRDTGIGIKKDKHNVIFERFRQLDESLAREHGGNGLGLAISKALVELMGGKIWLESEQGKGTTFFFNIPFQLKARERKIETKDRKTSGFKWNGKKILVVEDDNSSISFMKVLFRMTNAEVIYIPSGYEAIELYMKEKDFDLILMDIQLPDINGLEVTKMIKGINKYVPIIAQTAYAMHGDEEKCLQAGCDDYISKPVKITDMFNKMNKFLSS